MGHDMRRNAENIRAHSIVSRRRRFFDLAIIFVIVEAASLPAVDVCRRSSTRDASPCCALI